MKGTSTSYPDRLVHKLYTNDTPYDDEWNLVKPEDPSCGILLEFKVSTTSVSIQCVGSLATGTEWSPLIQQSAAAWNNAISDINITVSTNSSNYTIEVGSYSSTWFGATYPSSVTSGSIDYANIKINSRTCGTESNNRKSTISHEFGHLFGLADNPPVSGNYSLMNYDRDRNLVYVPQPYDIMNVKYYYSIN